MRIILYLFFPKLLISSHVGANKKILVDAMMPVGYTIMQPMHKCFWWRWWGWDCLFTYSWKSKYVVGRNQPKPQGFPTGYDCKTCKDSYRQEEMSTEFIIFVGNTLWFFSDAIAWTFFVLFWFVCFLKFKKICLSLFTFFPKAICALLFKKKLN